MSLDVSLTNSDGVEVFDANITHNLGKMAQAAGVYQACWRPEELGITTAAQLIPLLQAGLCKLVSDPTEYKQYNSPNGWGLYKHFVPWLTRYLEACQQYPDAIVSANC